MAKRTTFLTSPAFVGLVDSEFTGEEALVFLMSVAKPLSDISKEAPNSREKSTISFCA
ncbi:Uncharacterised protein [Vibrio cholerae]|nr:Uncharacterised protein [Vibrio cholerae]